MKSVKKTKEKLTSKPHRVAVFEGLLAIFTGAFTVLLSLLLSGVSYLNLSQPLQFQGDSLVVANTILSAQIGSPFYFAQLGAPSGQRLGFSAFGIQWFQSYFAGALTFGEPNPWLAANRYMIYSIFVIAIAAFLASRLVGINRIASVAIGGSMGLLRGIFAWAGWPFLQNYAGLLLITAIAISLMSGRTLSSLLPAQLGSQRSTAAYSWLLVIFAACLTATGDNYYIWFGLMVLGLSLVLSFFTKARSLQTLKSFMILISIQTFIIFLEIAPIASSRVLSGLPLMEPSTGDRRAFAALANGGELPAAFMPEQESFSMGLLKNFTPFGAFINEYQMSSIIISKDSRAGIATILVIVILGLFFFQRFLNKQGRVFVAENSKIFTSTIIALVLSFLLFVRGGLGLLISFFFPFLRGYDRAVILISFCALLVLGLISSGQLTQKRFYKALGALGLILVLLDNISGIKPRVQNLQNEDNGYFISAKPEVIENLVDSARKNFKKDCSILVTPVNTYPVDFEAVIVSYLTYETIKPGLVQPGPAWTAGSIPGTPGANFNQRFRELFLAKDYKLLLNESQNAGVCGAVSFGGLQDALNSASPGVFDSSKTIEEALSTRFTRVCFTDSETGIKLFCPEKPKT